MRKVEQKFCKEMTQKEFDGMYTEQKRQYAKLFGGDYMQDNFEILDNSDLKMVLEHLYGEEVEYGQSNSVVVENKDIEIYSRFNDDLKHVYISVSKELADGISVNVAKIIKQPTLKKIKEFCTLASNVKVGE